jgi:hypothetical protein
MTPGRTFSSTDAAVLISFAVAAGDCSGMRYMEAVILGISQTNKLGVVPHIQSHCLVFQGQPFLCISTRETRCFSINKFAKTEIQ